MKYGIASLLIVAIASICASSAEEARICTPGTYRDGLCGRCVCNGEGTGEDCDTSGCLEPFPSGSDANGVGKRIVRAAGGRCRPGSTFMMDCNTCQCPPSGIAADAACTLMACPPGGSSSRPGGRYNRRWYPRW